MAIPTAPRIIAIPERGDDVVLTMLFRIMVRLMTVATNDMRRKIVAIKINLIPLAFSKSSFSLT